MIYLDHAATSWPKPDRVSEAIAACLREAGGNPGRAAHRMAREAEGIIDRLRSRLAEVFDSRRPERVILTASCTDSLNMAIKGVLAQGDHVITTDLEHNSVTRPLQHLLKCGVIEVSVLPSVGGFIEPAAVGRAWKSNTRLVACTSCSNVLGTIQPISSIAAEVRSRGGLLLVDHAQGAGLIELPAGEAAPDLVAIPGHKGLLGPPGLGVLIVGERVKAVRAWREGGTGGDSASALQPAEWPYCLEAGTPNVIGCAGLLAAIEGLDARVMAQRLAYEQALAAELTDRLGGQAKIRLYGPAEPGQRTGIVLLNIDGLAPEELAAILDSSFDTGVRAGLHCAPGAHRTCGTFPAGAVRLSPGPSTTRDEIAAAASALLQIAV